MTEEIKILLIKKKMSISQLAKKLNTSKQNLSNKFKRDNFQVSDLEKIIQAVNAELEIVIRLENDEEIKYIFDKKKYRKDD